MRKKENKKESNKHNYITLILSKQGNRHVLDFSNLPENFLNQLTEKDLSQLADYLKNCSDITNLKIIRITKSKTEQNTIIMNKTRTGGTEISDLKFKTQDHVDDDKITVFLTTLIEGNKNLKVIDLSSNELDDKFIESFVPFIEKNTSLKSINLSNNFIYFKGIKKIIGAAKKHPSLNFCNLSKNSAGNIGLEQIATKNTITTIINLREAFINDMNVLDINKINKTLITKINGQINFNQWKVPMLETAKGLYSSLKYNSVFKVFNSDFRKYIAKKIFKEIYPINPEEIQNFSPN